ncbi:YceI family protein [Ekhidna sp.]|uniref:YceI family protein n=1 Tax=Ekhidna sp. TaxID=2608089 RepID=UPI003B501698
MLFVYLIYLIVPYQEVRNAHVTFEISHMGVLTVEGSFKEINVQINRVSDNQWIATGEVDASSIQTGNSSRDETILTEQYLNVEEYPTVPFKAIINRDKRVFQMDVEIEIRGIPVTLKSALEQKNERFVSKTITISRKEIGLDFGAMDSLIGDEIALVIHPRISEKDLIEMDK